ncbi:GIY-YIG nuclease family protein [Methanobrevibacter sp.]|uniref:GIY-YIG nuclease family protein n=1 Tax=Methanobrevibacter sp. TaxID=66852 RepID=UPI00386920A8
MVCGIYMLTNKLNGKSYIGASVNITNRWYAHKNKARNARIAKLVTNVGKENFSFSVLEECPLDELDDKEKYYIDLYDTLVPNGYNVHHGGKIENSTGFWRVSKAKRSRVKIGYEFRYSTDYSKNKKDIVNKDILKLKKAVEEKGFEWKIIDEDKAKKTIIQNQQDLDNERFMSLAYSKNTTGFYRVHKKQNSYVYTYPMSGKNKTLTNTDIRLLKKRVESKGLPWVILDEFKAKHTLEENDYWNKYLKPDNSNKTGFYRVYKSGNSYYYKDKITHKILSSTDIKVLQEKVEEKNWAWEIFDEEKAKQTIIDSEEYNKFPFNHRLSLATNKTGFFRVDTVRNNGCKQKYCYRYGYYVNGKRKYISSVNLRILEKKVKDKGLPWMIIDEEKAKKSIMANKSTSHRSNKTGFYRLSKDIHKNAKRGVIWVYRYRVNGKNKVIKRVDLRDLREEVLKRGLPWEVIDEEKAKQTIRESEQNNGH